MNAIRFGLNGTTQTVTDVSPSTTVLDWLRAQHLTGTKEGCAEGDCGACTVVLDRGVLESSRYQAVNSCLMLLPQINNLDVLTVEGIAQPDGNLHPVQKELIATDGTQCGFCTPGFVMAMYAFAQSDEPRDEPHIHEALAGNLCRCTGYRAIVDACKKIPLPEPDRIGSVITGQWSRKYEVEAQKFIAPNSLDEMLELRAANPDAIIWAGGTDLGIRASKEREQFPFIISTGNLPALRYVEETSEALEIGAAVTYTGTLPFIDKHFPSFGALIRRIGSRQIRNLGTFAGNLVTASPIGDTTPCLIALGAEIRLASKRDERSMLIEDFITGYRKTALAPDEVVTGIRVPFLKPDARFEAYKLSKRFDQDISAVIGAFYLAASGNAVKEFRAVYGGMADRPKRAAKLEAMITGKPIGQATTENIEAAIGQDFAPLSDHRAGSIYRLRAAAGLVQRFQMEVQHSSLRLETL